METLAGLLGGLGLFFIGIKALGQHLQSLAGPRLRAVVARLTASAASAGLAGLALGAITQSSNAATLIMANMRASGLLTLAQAMPVLAWANLGTAGLVLLATFDMRLAALLLLGVMGCVSFFGHEGLRGWRPGVGAMTGLGLVFLGLSIIKEGAAPLRDAALMRELILFFGDAPLPPFVLGAVVTLVAQSSSIISILTITLHDAGLLSFQQAMLGIYGASLGSGVAVMLLAGGPAGSTRQVFLYQAAFKASGTIIFLALHVIERISGLPLVLALLGRLAATADIQLALLFALMQLATALLLWPLNRAMRPLLERLAPSAHAELLGQPQFIYAEALEDAASALELARRDQALLLSRIPLLLDGLRQDGPAPPLPAEALSAAGAAVEAALAEFHTRLLATGPQGAVLGEAVALQARLRLLRDLRVATAEFAAAAAQAGEAPPMAMLAEALHALLEQLSDAADADDRAILLAMTGDRGAMMRRLRAAAGPDIPPDILHQATAAFERAVWLVRSIVRLEEDG